MEDLDDVYALSLCTYVLNLANHHYEEIAFNILESKAKTKDDLKWWSKPVPEGDKNPWFSMPRSVDVEMTSYNMLTYLRRNLIADALPLMKWMIKQRNAEGGFASTQVHTSLFLNNHFCNIFFLKSIVSSFSFLGHSHRHLCSIQTWRKISQQGQQHLNSVQLRKRWKKSNEHQSGQLNDLAKTTC